MKIYTYKSCSTCRNAIKYLNEKGIEYTELPIRETPPNPVELQFMLTQYDGNIKRLLNTSSKDYRELGIKDRIDTMTPSEVFELLQKNGNLVKRPFLITDDYGLVGFKVDEWDKTLK